MLSRQLLAERVALIEVASTPAVEGDLREIRRQINILDDARSKTVTRRSKEVRRREERLAWRILEQRTARALRKLKRTEVAA